MHFLVGLLPVLLKTIIPLLTALPRNLESPIFLEEPNPCRTTRTIGDISIFNYDAKGSAYLVVSIIHTSAQSHVQRAVKGLLERSKIRYDQKMTMYPELGSSFKPLVLESNGDWHPMSYNT